MTRSAGYVPEPGAIPEFDSAVKAAFDASMWRLQTGECINGSWLFVLDRFEEGELQRTFAGCGCRSSSCTAEPFAELPPEPPGEHWHSMVSPCFASDASICRDRSTRAPQTGFRLP